MKTPLATLCLVALLASHPPLVMAQQTTASIAQNQGLTVELVIQLLNAGVTPEKVTDLIQQTPSDFNLSLADINNLRGRLPERVLDAMVRARKAGSNAAVNPPIPQPSTSAGGPPPPIGINPTPVNPGSGNTSGIGTGGTNSTGNTGNTNTVGGTGGSGATPLLPLHSAVRLSEAKAVDIPRTPWSPPDMKPVGCPKGYTVVTLYFENGSPSVARLNDSGKYCFTLDDFNPLYNYSINAKISSPSGDAFALLNAAIATLKGLATGAATPSGSGDADKATTTPPTPSPSKSGARSACTVQLTEVLGVVKARADKLQALLTAVVPNRTTKEYVSFRNTAITWEPVAEAFNEFESALKNLQSALPDVGNRQDCDTDLLAQAEAILIDDYPPLQRQYRELATRIANPQVTPNLIEAEAVDTADVNVTSYFANLPVNSKPYHLDASFGILSSSAGFLVTRLPARSYTSATAPDPADPTKTQNVLRVDNNDGLRTTLAVLLTANAPWLNRRNIGLGVSAGPVFDISSGKADTSRFGFFGGLSARVTPWVFLTPGFHFGEFADFPQGFVQPGQVIPANTGTPTPNKRYTARFAFAVTFKLKDLGSALGGSNR